MNTKKVKVVAASVGTAGVLGMGVLTATFGGSALAEPADPAPPGPVENTEATLPETSTQTTAPSEPTEPSAVPEIEGPAPLPPELEGVPG